MMGIDADPYVPVKNSRCGMRRSPHFPIAAIWIMLVAAMAFGCGQREALLGKYEAVSQTPTGRLTLTLELQSDGKGFWSVETDNAPFRWDLYRNKIRLHTQTGGVIQGTLEKDSLHIAMPGQGVIQFTKIR